MFSEVYPLHHKGNTKSSQPQGSTIITTVVPKRQENQGALSKILLVVQEHCSMSHQRQ